MAKASQYLRIEDKSGRLAVEGEAIDDEHVNEIDLSSWGWGVEDPAAPAAYSKSDSTSKTKTDDKTKAPKEKDQESDNRIRPAIFTFSKRTDRSSIRLLNAMDRGEVFPSAIVYIEEEFAQSSKAFDLKIFLKDVFVVDLSWSVRVGRAGLDMEENWQFNYSDVTFEFVVPGGGVIPASFVKPADSTQGASKRAAPTKGEQQDDETRRIEELVKAALKKMGR